jgi:AraC family transcriptional regulator
MHSHTITSVAERELRPDIFSNTGPIAREIIETPAGLLATATAVLETDHDAAKIYIGRAAELLGLDLAQAAFPTPARSQPRGGLAPWQVKRLRAYIARNLASKTRATELAAVVELSTSHFFRAFRETFGRAPLAYIMQQRMLRAQELMLNSRRPIAAIALDCGMCDQPHFTRVFRRVVGLNPRAWRRKFGLALPSAPREQREVGRPIDPTPSRRCADQLEPAAALDRARSAAVIPSNASP